MVPFGRIGFKTVWRKGFLPGFFKNVLNQGVIVCIWGGGKDNRAGKRGGEIADG